MNINNRYLIPPIVAILLGLTISFNTSAKTAIETWVASFNASPQHDVILRPPHLVLPLENQTVRNIVHLSIGGESLRVRFSNVYGSQPLVINRASVGVAGAEGRVKSGKPVALTFGGESDITIPVGVEAYSDKVNISTEDDSDLAISIYIKDRIPNPTVKDITNKTSYINFIGDETMATQFRSNYKVIDYSYYATGVDVISSQPTKTIVTIGDSLTDGYGATLDNNSNYPSMLSKRLQRSQGDTKYSVVNAAISGNRLLTNSTMLGPSVLTRFNDNVLSQANVSHVIVQIGINDIGLPEIRHIFPTKDDSSHVSTQLLISGLKQLAIKAKTRGVKIYVGTLMPFKYCDIYTPEGEQKRQSINQWLRTTNLFDGIIDFDRAVADPDDPSLLNRAYDSGDNIHLNDLGYAKMAESIDLTIFD